MTVQDQHLQRVAATTKEAILTFVNTRLNSADPRFTADALRNYVMNSVVGGVSPGSSDRVLRMLRQQGKLNYVVLNRGKSLYEARSLGLTAFKPKTEETTSNTKWMAEIKWSDDVWAKSGNIGLHAVKFDTKEAAQTAINLYGSKGAVYRVVEV